MTTERQRITRTSEEFTVPRRTVLRASATVAGVGITAGAGTFAAATAGAQPAGRTPRFVHGVASGDPLPDAVILWTRVSPTLDATPGSGVGPTVTVAWEVATDASFANVVRSGSVEASAASDHTVKIDATGLSPSTRYHYRFVSETQTSPTGITHTAPAADADLDRLRFGVVSCSNWEAGYFGAYRHLAARGDLDAVIHLGDYIYEYGTGEFAAGSKVIRAHEPTHDIVTLSDYRQRHAQYKTDPDLAALHAKLPWIVTWDDHETANDAYDGGAENHDPATQGAWQERRAAGMQAYLEWMPVRAGGTMSEPRLYRRLQFGNLMELSMLDLRSYRSRQVSPASREADAFERSITGPQQMDWLRKGLVSADATWKVVGNPVMITPCLFPPLEPQTTAAVTEMLGVPAGGLPYNADQWDGYTADRRTLFDALHGSDVRNAVFITGDIHSSWAADLPVDPANYPASPTVGTELVVPSVTSDNVDDIVGAPPRTIAVAAEEAFRAANHHIKYVELDSHGYAVLEVNRQAAQMDWFYLDDRTNPATGVRRAVGYRVVADGGRVEIAPPLP
ncbi:alkaline phosphatase D family protein [Rhodococcus sp. NPDC058521]|uniref:alkaline phosphatase D family protein n=1 Tax=Rhodococcus sp. NPDC058521 TaxID=3346536 RepID=UPI00365B9316